MKTRLIFPQPKDIVSNRYSADSFFTKSIRAILGLGNSSITPPLSLLMLAAVSPPDTEVQLIDERLEEIDFDEEVDLVGITAVTRTAPRAYQIASEYRKRGRTVVLGGIHPSVLPHEASSHADAVAIGEGEKIWPQILDNYKQGTLKPLYRAEHITDLDELPFPRYDVLSHPEWYSTAKVLTASRGCENSCTFCSAGLASGKRFRVRNVRAVVNEIEATPGKFVMFLDDNLGGDIAYAKELFRALIPLNIKWFGEMTLSALEDIELIELMAKSGCFMLDLGFESTSPSVIATIRKQRTNDPTRYRELIRRVHACGIQILGEFILGFDNDDRSSFQELIDFINQTCIEMPQINTLVPYPGSPIYRQFERENRLFHKNWEYYESAARHVVYQPMQMTPQELITEYLLVLEEIHKTGPSLKRLAGAKTLFSIGSLPVIYSNHKRRSGVRAEIAERKEVIRT